MTPQTITTVTLIDGLYYIEDVTVNPLDQEELTSILREMGSTKITDETADELSKQFGYVDTRKR